MCVVTQSTLTADIAHAHLVPDTKFIWQFSEWFLHLRALQVLQAELEDEKEGAEQQRMAAQADLTSLKAKLITHDSEVASLRSELESEVHLRMQTEAQHKAAQADLAGHLTIASGEAQELKTKHAELVSQV